MTYANCFASAASSNAPSSSGVSVSTEEFHNLFFRHAPRGVAFGLVQANCLLDIIGERAFLDVLDRSEFHVAHSVAFAFQKTMLVLQLGAAPETDIDIALVRSNPNQRSMELIDWLRPFVRFGRFRRSFFNHAA